MSFQPEQVASAIRFLRRTDPIMAGVIKRTGPFGLKVKQSGYPVVVQSILSQQISTVAAQTIHRRLQELLPGKKIRPQMLQALTDEQFRSVGVSPQKLASLRDLTQKTLDGTLRFRRIARALDEEAIAELTQVRGIGRWTAQMYLLFSLGRPDIFAPDDLGLRKAIANLYALPNSPKRQHFEDLSAMWRPWRSVASWYLWRSLEWSDDQQDS